MKILLLSSFCVLGILANSVEQESPSADPEYLDKLLTEKRYEEFSELMHLGDPELAYPKHDGKSLNELMLNKDLSEGDIVLTSEQREEARQGIDFKKNNNGRFKWPNQVPYVISNDFNQNERNLILRSIERWNNRVRCIKFVPRNNQNDYTMFYNGNGCYSMIGRIGGQQGISLQRVNGGCMYEGVVLHEMEHAIGIHHEHNRLDRDNFINIIWDNVPRGQESNYEKTNPNRYGLQGRYDYYSVMHYPVNAVQNNKRVFQIKQSGIDERRIGTYSGFTDMNLQKISELYC